MRNSYIYTYENKLDKNNELKHKIKVNAFFSLKHLFTFHVTEKEYLSHRIWGVFFFFKATV